jgi:DNA-binding response OmpR family regulator
VRILIADDDDVSRIALQAMLEKRGHEVIAAENGAEAWQVLQEVDSPPLVILDWMMPELDGIEICKLAREHPGTKAKYLILLTAQGKKENILEGLRAGANDYITKPFDREELEARVNVGVKILNLQAELAARVSELEAALANVKQLQGLLPICMYCKSIRDDKNYWHQVESYCLEHTAAKFTHGICPGCWDKVVEPQLTEQGQ